MSETQCPTCQRDDFASEHGVKLHHAKIHGESLSTDEKECEFCGDTFEYYPDNSHTPRFCCYGCRDSYMAEERSGSTDTFVCEVCEEEAEVPSWYTSKRRFCSISCWAEAGRSEEWKENMSEIMSGREVTWKNKISESLTNNPNVSQPGPENGNWKGGYEPYYGPDWRSQRRKALERDDCECQVCGRGEAEIGREPDVHHIRPFRKFGRVDHEEANALDNLVTLCPEHHRQVEKGVVSLEGYEQ